MQVHNPKWLIDDFRYAVRHMSRRSSVYRMLKEELKAQGHWKDKPRGDAKAGGEARKLQLSPQSDE